MTSKEELQKAVKTIKEYCAKSVGCSVCVFFDPIGISCPLSERLPYNWIDEMVDVK